MQNIHLFIFILFYLFFSFFVFNFFHIYFIIIKKNGLKKRVKTKTKQKKIGEERFEKKKQREERAFNFSA